MVATAAVPLTPVDACPLLTGTAIPQVTLRIVDGEAFDLNSAIRQQPCVLVSYRGA